MKKSVTKVLSQQELDEEERLEWEMVQTLVKTSIFVDEVQNRINNGIAGLKYLTIDIDHQGFGHFPIAGRIPSNGAMVDFKCNFNRSNSRFQCVNLENKHFYLFEIKGVDETSIIKGQIYILYQEEVKENSKE